MNIPLSTRVLAKCAAFDQRTVGETDILAWAETIPDWVELEDAMSAVTMHYSRDRRRMMPVDLIQCAKESRARRLGYRLVEDQ